MAANASAETTQTGRADAPFSSLERARDEIRARKRAGTLPSEGVVVEALPGTYELRQTFELAAEDSGAQTTGIVYRASRAGRCTVRGGRALRGWKRVSDPQLLARLPEAARGNVLVANLREEGISEYGSAGGGGLELFFDEKPMTLARWPNEGFTTITDVVTSKPITSHGKKGDAVGQICYEGKRPERWAAEKDLWLHGYWFWDWSDQRMKVESITTKTQTITLTPP